MREDGPPRGDFPASAALLDRMRGSEALISARPGLFFTGYERLGGYPVFVERAQGAHFLDVDGNRFVDYLLGFGSVVLGHADPAVNRAVESALARGVNPTLLGREQLELAERLVELIPCADLVTFLRTGSDAVAAAVRLARAVTGRERVVAYGKHGWHDWCAANSPGVPKAYTGLVQPLKWNDIEHTSALFQAHPGEIACIVTLPYEIEPPAPGYLAALRDLAHANGALFVFDEVRSGFRIDLRGAQARFGVTPDLAAFSKAMANGHALSALAGRREVMEKILDLGVTVTFYRSPAAMSAGLATIARLEAGDVPARLEAIGGQLMERLDAAARAAGVPARAIGHPATPFIGFDLDSELERTRAMRLFCNAMLARGHLLTPAHHWFVCAATSEADIAATAEAARDVFAGLARAL